MAEIRSDAFGPLSSAVVAFCFLSAAPEDTCAKAGDVDTALPRNRSPSTFIISVTISFVRDDLISSRSDCISSFLICAMPSDVRLTGAPSTGISVLSDSFFPMDVLSAETAGAFTGAESSCPYSAISSMVSAGCPTFSMWARISEGSTDTDSSAILSKKSGYPWSANIPFSSSPRRSFRSCVSHTMRRCPPSVKRNFREVRNTFPIPIKPGVCAPPPTFPARDENVIPTGVSPVYSRFTAIMPLHSGTYAQITSKQPQLVMGLFIMEYRLKLSTVL